MSKNIVRLWDVKTGQQLSSLRGHTRDVWSVAFSPDGTFLASAGIDGTIRLWDVLTGLEILKFQGHQQVHAVAFSPKGIFSPTGSFLASGGLDGTVLLWGLPVAAGEASDRKSPSKLWKDLSAKDALTRYRASRAMACGQGEVVKFIATRLKPASASPIQVKRWIAALDADEYTVRQRASAELAELGLTAETALREALKARPSIEAVQRLKELLAAFTSPHPLTDQARREIRAVAVVEHIGIPRCQQILADLAKGNTRALATKLAAKAALQRLRGRGKPPAALPPPEMLKKVEKLIAQLGAESYKDREAAQKALVKMGKSIVPLLKPHLKSRDPEIRQRIQDILEQLGIK